MDRIILLKQLLMGYHLSNKELKIAKKITQKITETLKHELKSRDNLK